jgi:serine/threonine protein kinase
MADDLTNNLTGETIEHYGLEGMIGRGGMGTVYRAVDLNLARPVAIKVMHERYASQPEFQERFQQEAQAAARLEHPSIVRIYHFGREEGQLYIVMELIPGLSLGTYIKQLTASNQVIRLEETLLLTAQVAEALGYAHRKDVVHRDIKPDNILVKELEEPERADEPPLRAVVTDFGLARLLDEGVETPSDSLMGTLAYASPEQLLDQPLDGRSDIYSLGVVLFQMATGQLPFLIKTPADALQKHVHEPPPMPQELYPGLPMSVGQIIWKAMEKQPEDRYQTGDEMARDLRQALEELSDEELNFADGPTQSSVASMVVVLDEDPNLADTSRWLGDEAVRAPGYDTLYIGRAGSEPEVYSLHKRTFTIGRSEGNDIVLIGGNVSRWHARLDYLTDGWYVTDTGSTNGTFLDDTRLELQRPYSWYSGQVVYIGPFQLHLRMAGETAPQAAAFVTPPERMEETQFVVPVVAAAARSLSPPPDELISADMRPRVLKRLGISRVLLLNEGLYRTTVTVAATDPRNRLHIDAPTKQVSISPGQKGVVDFYLEGQRPLVGRRQAYPFIMQITTEAQDWGGLQGFVKVRPVISIWLILFFMLAILVAAGAVYAFVQGLLPWTPQSLFDALVAYFQSL